MNKPIRILVFIAPVIIILGIIFKLNHFPGANVITTVGAGTGIVLMALLIPDALKVFSGGFEKFNILFALFVIILTLLSMAFKISHWHGANVLLWIADVGIGLSTMLYLVDVQLEKQKEKSFLKVIILFYLVLLCVTILVTH